MERTIFNFIGDFMQGEILRFSGKVTGAASQTLLIPGVAGKIINIKRVLPSASAASTFRLQDDSTVPQALTAIHELVAGINIPLQYDRSSKTAAGKGVTITTSAGNVAVDIEYWLEP